MLIFVTDDLVLNFLRKWDVFFYYLSETEIFVRLLFYRTLRKHINFETCYHTLIFFVRKFISNLYFWNLLHFCEKLFTRYKVPKCFIVMGSFSHPFLHLPKNKKFINWFKFCVFIFIFLNTTYNMSLVKLYLYFHFFF